MGTSIAGYVTAVGCAADSDKDGIFLNYLITGQGKCCWKERFNRGRTAVHEVGHWLGLEHTFQGGCVGTDISTCNTEGDMVCDTPPTANSNFSNAECTPQNTCTETPNDETDMVENYMDYTGEKCHVIFTPGQKARMIATYNQCRQSIGNGASANCSTVGIDKLNLNNIISVFPNPTDGNIFVNFGIFDLGKVDIKVYNLVGEVIANVTDNISVPKKIKINLSDKSNGIYFVEVKTKNGSIAKKLILNN